MYRPTICPDWRSPLGYRAGTCGTCHAHHRTCTGPGGPGLNTRKGGDPE
jgi:hypothetical protein